MCDVTRAGLFQYRQVPYIELRNDIPRYVKTSFTPPLTLTHVNHLTSCFE